MAIADRTQFLVLLLDRCRTFQYDGATYFTTVKAFQPELAARIATEDLSDQVPFLGIEFTRAECIAREPTVAIYDYLISFYVVEAWYDDGTQDIDESVKHKWKVGDAFRTFLLTEAVNGIHQIMGMPKIDEEDVAAEDIVFGSLADRGAALALQFGASMIVLRLQGVHEEIS